MSKVDKAVCLAILKRGLRNSWYYLQSGQPAHAYINMDIAMLGDDYELDPTPQHDRVEQLAEQFKLKIEEIEQQKAFDRLAFIDKAGHGPVGMIALSSLLIWKTKKESIFVRPYRNAIRSTTRGKPLKTGERVLIVSDVATTGETILNAAVKLWERDAVVVGALVFFDQELDAKENLRAKDITLHSLFRKGEVLAIPDARDLMPDRKADAFHEFGGVM